MRTVQTLGRLFVIGCSFVFFAAAPALKAHGQDEEDGSVKAGIARVRTFDQTTIIPYAGASVLKQKKSVFMNYYTSGLAPGTVVTIWWVFFNNPEFCSTPNCGVPDLFNPNVNASLHLGGGRVIGLDGSASFGGYFAAGETTGFHILPGMPNPSPGLVDPKKTMIHLVARTHGTASTDPAVLSQQLTTFGGGCSVVPNPCANIQAAVLRP